LVRLNDGHVTRLLDTVPVGTALTSVKTDGNWSATSTLVAVAGPLLVTTMV